MQDDEKILRSCAWRARPGLGLTRDDLLQEGRLALWLARSAGRVPSGDDLHARRYLAQRAYGAMADASRTARGQWPAEVDELATEHEGLGAGPDAQAQVRQAIERLVRKGSPKVRECISLLAGGSSRREAARAMGVSASRVSQILNEARAIVAHCV